MTKPVIVDDHALRELERGARWYDQQRAGLGDALVDTVEGILVALPAGELHSLSVPGIPNDLVRRVLLERFPYAVIFAEATTAFHVVAIAHLKKKPNYWRKRLRRLLDPAPGSKR